MKLYSVRIKIGKYEFYKHVLAPNIEVAMIKAISYGTKKATKEERDGFVRVLSVVEISDEIIR